MISGNANGQAVLTIRSAVLCCLIALSLTGCLSGGGGSSSRGESSTSTDNQTAMNMMSAQRAAAAAPNTPPTISGAAPAGASVNQPYVFQPNAFDADGDELVFSIVNKPAWASFDAGSGRLSGTPSSAYSGLFADILISVTDGDAVASLAAFSIAVAGEQNGSATLSWQPPSANTDGSPLMDLAGYVIRYGTSLEDLTEEISIANPGLTTYVVTGLDPGTWYFQVAAFNSAGMESAPSTTVSKTVS